MFQAATGLRERGHDVTIVSRSDALLAARAAEHDVAFHGFQFRHQFDLTTILGLRRLIRDAKPDVIHVHKGLAHALALAATTGHRAGAFVVNRGVSFPLDRWNRGKYRTSRVDRIVTVCEQIKDVIVESGRLPREKVVVVYAGTDVTLFDPQRWSTRAFRREKSIDDDRFLIAQVGVRDWKGWQELIDSLSDVVLRHPSAHLALIGCRDDAERAKVSAYAESRGAGKHVTAVEYRTDMPNVFASCDLIVDASWAGTGITGTIREGMATRARFLAGRWVADSDEGSPGADRRDPRGNRRRSARGARCRRRAGACRPRILERAPDHAARGALLHDPIASSLNRSADRCRA